MLFALAAASLLLLVVMAAGLTRASSHFRLEAPFVEIADGNVYLKVPVAGGGASEFRALRDDHWPAGSTACDQDLFVSQTAGDQYLANDQSATFNSQYWLFAIDDQDHDSRYCFKAVSDAGETAYVVSETLFTDASQLATMEYGLLSVNGQKAKVSVTTADPITGWKVFTVNDLDDCRSESYGSANETLNSASTDKTVEITYEDDKNYCFWATRQYDYLGVKTHYASGTALRNNRLRRTVTANYSLEVRDDQLVVSLQETGVTGWWVIEASSSEECTIQNLKNRTKVVDTDTASQSISFRYEEATGYCVHAKRPTDNIHSIQRYVPADVIRRLRVHPDDIEATIEAQLSAGNRLTVTLAQADATGWQVIEVGSQAECNKDSFAGTLLAENENPSTITINYEIGKSYCFWPMRATDDIETNMAYFDRSSLRDIPANTNGQPPQQPVNINDNVGVVTNDERAPVITVSETDGGVFADADEDVVRWRYVVIAATDACDEFVFAEGFSGETNRIALPADLSEPVTYCFQGMDAAGNFGHEKYTVSLPSQTPGGQDPPENPGNNGSQDPENGASGGDNGGSTTETNGATENKTDDVEGSATNWQMFVLIGLGAAVLIGFGIFLYANYAKNKTVRF